MAQAPKPALQITPVAPTRFEKRGETYFADFGADAFGNLQLTLPANLPITKLTVRLGEKLDENGTIDRHPPGSVNYREITFSTVANQSVYKLEIPSKPRHNDKAAVHTPPEIGEITVFRYAEVETAANTQLPIEASSLRQLFVHTAFDDNASSFQSSDDTLNAVWELCKHTMKATTAFGVYIDGERERIPYEADAYINQLSHLACDSNPEVARYTIEHLLRHPTWPTEWSFHMPMMAAADYEMTGNLSVSDHNYDALKKKLLMEKAREDGLLKALAIVDWPSGERDGYNTVEGVNHPNAQQQIGPEINTVVNAFYYHALRKMAVLAHATQREYDAQLFEAKAKQVYQGFNNTFFDAKRGIYIDGEGSNHASLHANMFALAFGLVPSKHSETVADFVQSRGMACSVYGAQYVLEALYNAGRDDDALQLMTSHSQRSWWHMIELGSTMTLEAWDAKYKNNLTWNHAWGAAPANIISRFLLGVRPLEPGYKKILIAPRIGTLAWAKGKVPTPYGAVILNVQNGTTKNQAYQLEVEVPKGTMARIELPASKTQTKIVQDGKTVSATRQGNILTVDNVSSGKHRFRVES